MGPNQYQNGKNANNPMKVLYRNPGIEKSKPEPRYQNQGVVTETGTELKKQSHSNTSLFAIWKWRKDEAGCGYNLWI